MTEPVCEAFVKAIAHSTGYHFHEYRLARLSGGDINQAWQIYDRERRYFVKTNRADLLPMFVAEKAGLDEIYQSQTIRVPRVICCEVEGSQSFIVLEFLDISGSPDESLLARQLAGMHNHTARHFGFGINNTIGSTPQVNDENESWVDFWQVHRLGYQLELAKKNGLDSKMIVRGEILNASVDKFFSDYQPLASLLHGDLWSGNYAGDSKGNPVIFDPACYYGDHEADLAMMELFGQPGRRFFDVYDEVFSIDPGYTTRRELYNLYHILNHANLFGGHYSASARNLIERLLAVI